MTTRDKLFNVRLNDQEFARLNAIAEHHGVPGAVAVRMLLKKEGDALGIVVQAPTKARKGKRTAKRGAR